MMTLSHWPWMPAGLTIECYYASIAKNRSSTAAELVQARVSAAARLAVQAAVTCSLYLKLLQEKEHASSGQYLAYSLTGYMLSTDSCIQDLAAGILAHIWQHANHYRYLSGCLQPCRALPGRAASRHGGLHALTICMRLALTTQRIRLIRTLQVRHTMSAGIRSAAALACNLQLAAAGVAAASRGGTVLFPSSSAVCLLFILHGA
jgi:hypothetical protein